MPLNLTTYFFLAFMESLRCVMPNAKVSECESESENLMNIIFEFIMKYKKRVLIFIQDNDTIFTVYGSK